MRPSQPRGPKRKHLKVAISGVIRCVQRKLLLIRSRWGPPFRAERRFTIRQILPRLDPKLNLQQYLLRTTLQSRWFSHLCVKYDSYTRSFRPCDQQLEQYVCVKILFACVWTRRYFHAGYDVVSKYTTIRIRCISRIRSMGRQILRWRWTRWCPTFERGCHIKSRTRSNCKRATGATGLLHQNGRTCVNLFSKRLSFQRWSCILFVIKHSHRSFFTKHIKSIFIVTKCEFYRVQVSIKVLFAYSRLLKW